MKNNVETVTLQIASAKTRAYKKDGRVLDLTYNQVMSFENGKVSVRQIDDKDKYGDLVHDDLLKSLKAFIPHFMLQSERANLNEFTAEYFKKKEYFKKTYDYEVTGIHIKEHQGKNSVIFVGRQILKNGRVISMTPPMLCYDVDEEKDEDYYTYHKELKAAVDAYLTQCEKYLEGHHGKPAQTTLNFDGDPEESEEKIRKIS